jgi:probable rRNA maturation factor
MKRVLPTTERELRQRLDLEVSYASRRPWAPSSRLLAKWASAALLPGLEPVALSVHIVGKTRSRRLNAQYRRQDKPTNVLSFAGAGSTPDGRFYLGELVICAPLVALEARAQDKTREAHWAHLTIHGVLHLLGFDHVCRREAEKMASQEIQILDRLGFSDPYL